MTYTSSDHKQSTPAKNWKGYDMPIGAHCGDCGRVTYRLYSDGYMYFGICKKCRERLTRFHEVQQKKAEVTP